MRTRHWGTRPHARPPSAAAIGAGASLVGLLLVLPACGNRNEVGQPQAPQPGAGSELPRPGTPAQVEAAPATAAVQPAKPLPADASAKSSLASPSDGNAAVIRVCNEMCDSMAKSCEEDAAKTCRRNCTRYEHVAAECRSAAQTALTCARDAEDLLCIEMAPASCMPQFKEYHTCTADPQAYSPKVNTQAEGQDQWEFVKDEANRYTVEFPTVPQQVNVDGISRWVATLGQAKLYAASYEAPQYSKLAMKLMKSGEKFLGKCSEDYRLRGQYETPGAIHVSFVARCKDGTPWVGKLHLVNDQQVFVTAVEGRGADEAVTSRFFDSFKQY